MDKLVIGKVIKVLDEFIVSSGKSIITLRKANELLRNHLDDDLRNLDIKTLLDTNQIPHAYQTDTKPRQWQIPFSSPHDYNKLRKEYLKNNQIERKSNLVDTPKSKINWFVISVVVLIFLCIYFLKFSGREQKENSNSSYVNTYKSEESKVGKAKEENALNGQRFTFKSTLNDNEYDGQIVQTNHETTYHIFDFINMTVTQKSMLDGKWIAIKYPINGYYKQAGILATTYVLEVNEQGVKEIWFCPEVPNLGYDFTDGTRIACYEIVKVNS
jgi:hypothetical protein